MRDKKTIALERAKKDANEADIQTTAEGRSYLKARFNYWMKQEK